MVAGCQGLPELHYGESPPPVTAVEWNETRYKILVQQVALPQATESQLQAECRAHRQREVMKSVTDGKFLPIPACASVSKDLEDAEYLSWRQEQARDLLEQKPDPSRHTETGSQALSE